MTDGYGRARLPRAVVLTFDNLGEVSAIGRGEWTGRHPLGSDPSVTQALPWVLDALDRSGLTATFFVEADNYELNPLALAQIVSRGHELGAHGWQHETWGELASSPHRERELLERITRTFADTGFPVSGFRPPGGTLTPATLGLLDELGYMWCSPAAAGPAEARPFCAGAVCVVPFIWELVDAFHLMERFAGLRNRHGGSAAPAAADAVGRRFAQLLGGGGSGVQTVVMHPFLMLEPAWREQVELLLERLGELRRSEEAWVVAGGEFAAWWGLTVRE